MDELDDSKELAEELKLTFPLLSDPEMAIIKSYGVEDPGNEVSWPAIFIIDREGGIAWRNIVDNYKVRPAVADVLSEVDTAIKAEPTSKD